VAYAHFERLSAMDLSFLAMEDGRAHMHIGAVSIYDATPLRSADGGIDFERVLSFTEAQLHKFPRFRQRLDWVPGFGQPVWIDDDRFNLRFHVRHTALPPPGHDRQLKRLAGRILSQEFDRAKPLWENWFVDGLTGDRFAVISKVHHCMADGISGVAMGNLLVGPSADYEPPPRREWMPRPAPDRGRLVLDELRHRATAPIRLLRSARPGTEGDGSTATGAGVLGLVGNVVQRGSPTPLNVEVGPHRRFDWARLPFADVRRIGKSAGGTVNDVVLTVATGALRGFLRQRGVSVDDLDFRAVVPVNMRAGAERSPSGNRVSEMIAHLPLAEADPWARLQAVVELTGELKASGQSGAGDLMGQAVELLPPQLLAPLFRLASRSSVANIILTNVPGPRVPVYLLGARQLETYPVVPILANQGLGIALMSYDDGLFWGFNADWDAVPDLHDLVVGVTAGFDELNGAAP
jgi:WS/DGAT/MGAT family acyltransferase